MAWIDKEREDYIRSAYPAVRELVEQLYGEYADKEDIMGEAMVALLIAVEAGENIETVVLKTIEDYIDQEKEIHDSVVFMKDQNPRNPHTTYEQEILDLESNPENIYLAKEAIKPEEIDSTEKVAQSVGTKVKVKTAAVGTARAHRVS